MISLHVVLLLFIILFAIIGSMRGWAKELLVTFSAIFVLFFLNLCESFVPFFKELVVTSSPATLFWIRTGTIAGLAFFGYQAPKLQRLANSGRFVRHFLQDLLLGGLLGAVNGFLIFGTVWFYLYKAEYPFLFVAAPDPASVAGIASLSWIKYLPPSWLLGSPAIYFAVVICFIFVLVAFI